MLESSLEKWARTTAEEQYGMVVLKLNNKASSGWPDRQFLLYRDHFFVEFKKKNEPCKRIQSQRIVELIDLGHDVYVLDNKEDVISVFNQYTGRVGTETVPTESRKAHAAAVRGGPLVGPRDGKNYEYVGCVQDPTRKRIR